MCFSCAKCKAAVGAVVHWVSRKNRVARLLTENTERVTIEDVAGIDEAKGELHRNRRLPERPTKIPAPRRKNSPWLLAGGPSRNR